MFQLDPRSSKSIYEQVIDNFKMQIMTGVLPQDSRLPSVRELSGQLTVNPNTVQKAYRELEREGYIYTVTGRGSFVSSPGTRTPDPRQQEKLLHDVAGAYRELRFLGLSRDEAEEQIRAVIDEAEKGGNCV